MGSKRKAKVLGPAPSKTYPAVWVLCTCGKKNKVHVRSWHGNGKKKCEGCDKFIKADSLLVVAAA